MRKSGFAASLVGALLMLAVAQVSADESNQEMVKIWKVDFSGRPPFKRELVEVPVADFAALEAGNEVLRTERVWTVDYSGKPPFKRRFEEIPIIDAASLELIVEDEPQLKKRPHGSLKRHR